MENIAIKWPCSAVWCFRIDALFESGLRSAQGRIIYRKESVYVIDFELEDQL